MPFLLQRLGIRLIVTAASVFITAATVMLGSESLFGTAFGLFVRVLGTACIEIPLSAYLMDRIPRDRFGPFEPKRILFQGVSLAIAVRSGEGSCAGSEQRRVLATSYALAATCLVLTAGFWAPQVAPLFLVASAFAASIVDGPGNIAFLRDTGAQKVVNGRHLHDLSRRTPIRAYRGVLDHTSRVAIVLSAPRFCGRNVCCAIVCRS